MKVALVGYPNVGKSSLVNRLTGSREAVVHARPGITRDRKDLPCEWNGRRFTLVDTGGIDVLDEDPLASSIREQARAGVAESRGRGAGRGRPRRAAAGRRGARRSAAHASRCRASSRPTSATAPRTSRWPPSSTASASATPLPVSAAQGLGTGDLLDRIVELLDRAAPEDAEVEDEEAVRLAVIGRPNVGKSSLVNRFLGQERVIVSDRAGTTRDAIDTVLRFGDARDHAGRHRRHPPRRQGRRLGRVLHGAALAAGRRTRRRGAGGVRRLRRGHRPGHADRRAGDEGGLRDRAGAEQVGPARRAGRRRGARPRPRARAGPGGREAAPAPQAC